jgi:hypothetical protein
MQLRGSPEPPFVVHPQLPSRPPAAATTADTAGDAADPSD